MGGYFVINGNEKIIRMLLTPRRNHVRSGGRCHTSVFSPLERGAPWHLYT